MMLSHESRIYDHELYNEPLVCAQLIISIFFSVSKRAYPFKPSTCAVKEIKQARRILKF